MVLARTNCLLFLRNLLPLDLNQFLQVAFLTYFILVNGFEELNGLLDREEHVALSCHIQRKIVNELLDEEHLRLKVLDPRLHYYVHDYSEVLISCQLKFLCFDLHSLPELQDILIYLGADFTDYRELLSGRDRA